MAAKRIALFIDADNISARFGKQIIETLESRGEVLIRRIYGNWEKALLHGWNDCILNFSLRAIQQPDFAAGKNATDMSLTIDAMDVLYGGKADIFAIVSNDSDFTPLVIRLREGGMKIIGMGNSQAASSFRFACDEFIDFDAPTEIKIAVEPKKKFYTPEKKSTVQMSLFNEDKVTEFKPPLKSSVIGNTSEVTLNYGVKFIPENVTAPLVVTNSNKVNGSKLQSENAKKLQQIHEVLREATTVHRNAEGFCLLADAGAYLKSKNLGFTVRDFGYNQLKEFIVAFPNLYETCQDDAEQHFYYRCLVTSEQKAFDYKIKRVHKILRESARVYGTANGVLILNHAEAEIKNLGFSVKDLGYSSLEEFILSFPELYEVQKAGNIVSYRCLTNAPEISADKLQQIHDVLRETAKIYGDEKGFVNLGQAGNAILQKKINIKDSGHSKLSKFISAFPNLYELQENSYRCK